MLISSENCWLPDHRRIVEAFRYNRQGNQRLANEILHSVRSWSDIGRAIPPPTPPSNYAAGSRGLRVAAGMLRPPEPRLTVKSIFTSVRAAILGTAGFQRDAGHAPSAAGPVAPLSLREVGPDRLNLDVTNVLNEHEGGPHASTADGKPAGGLLLNATGELLAWTTPEGDRPVAADLRGIQAGETLIGVAYLRDQANVIAYRSMRLALSADRTELQPLPGGVDVRTVKQALDSMDMTT